MPEKLKLGTLYRSAEVERTRIDEQKRTVVLSFSSETPVERWFGFEVLSHGPGAMDDSRLQGRGAFLREHDTRQQIGKVERAWIENGRGFAEVRFGKSPMAEQEWQDVKDGIRSSISVGYRVQKIEMTGEENGVKTYRATRWQPLEISTVAVPGDPTVGIGRAGENNETEVEITMRTLLDQRPAEGGGGSAAPAVAAPPALTDTRAELQRNVDGILALAETYKMPLADAQRFIKEGKSKDEFQGFILESRHRAVPVPQLTPDIGMSEKEVKRYSIVRAIRQIANKQPLDGLEREVSDAVAKQIHREPQGFFLPNDLTSRALDRSFDLNPLQTLALARALGEMGKGQRALNATTPSAGGYLIGTETLGSSMIELLRNNMVIASLGTRNLSGLVGDVAIPKHTGGATAYWLGETATITDSQQTFGQLLLTPHRLGAATPYSKQLLAQASIDVEAFVRMDLMEVLAVAKDLACINGSGAAGQPLGIMQTTGIGSITYGAAADWAKVVENETTLFAANVRGVPAFVSSYATQGKWKTKSRDTGSGVFLINDGLANGYRFAPTTQMPSGDKTIFGVFSDLIVADWDGIDVVVDPYSLATSNQVRVVINLMTDVGIRHPVSFVVSTDSGAQ